MRVSSVCRNYLNSQKLFSSAQLTQNVEFSKTHPKCCVSITRQKWWVFNHYTWWVIIVYTWRAFITRGEFTITHQEWWVLSKSSYTWRVLFKSHRWISMVNSSFCLNLLITNSVYFSSQYIQALCMKSTDVISVCFIL